jgi:hypothetical protein
VATNYAPATSLGRCHPAAITAMPTAEPYTTASTEALRRNRGGATSVAAIPTARERCMTAREAVAIHALVDHQVRSRQQLLEQLRRQRGAGDRAPGEE